MQDYGLVSIITPTWACGAFIVATIKSVQEQTYKNWELLIQDDCSTDNTKEVVEKCIAENPELTDKIKYECNPKNSGAAITRNNALRRAKGRWIAFLDADDLWLPEKLERQLAFLKENNADIVLCKMECKTPENEFIHNFPNLDKSQQISYTSLLKYNSASTQTFFGKTFCFKNIMFDASMPRLQDWDEALRLSLQYKIFFHILNIHY